MVFWSVFYAFPSRFARLSYQHFLLFISISFNFISAFYHTIVWDVILYIHFLSHFIFRLRLHLPLQDGNFMLNRKQTENKTKKNKKLWKKKQLNSNTFCLLIWDLTDRTAQNELDEMVWYRKQETIENFKMISVSIQTL